MGSDGIWWFDDCRRVGLSTSRDLDSSQHLGDLLICILVAYGLQTSFDYNAALQSIRVGWIDNPDFASHGVRSKRQIRDLEQSRSFEYRVSRRPTRNVGELSVAGGISRLP